MSTNRATALPRDRVGLRRYSPAPLDGADERRYKDVRSASVGTRRLSGSAVQRSLSRCHTELNESFDSHRVYVTGAKRARVATQPFRSRARPRRNLVPERLAI